MPAIKIYKSEEWHTQLYDWIVIAQLNLLLIGKIIYDFFKDHILPVIYMIVGTGIYIFNTYLQPATIEFLERFYLSITMWYIIAKSFISEQLDDAYKYLLNRLPDYIWGYIWRLNCFNQCNVSVVAPTLNIDNKLLSAFNSGIFLLAENYMLNIIYIKQILALTERASNQAALITPRAGHSSLSDELIENKTPIESKSQIDNFDVNTKQRSIITYYYKINKESRILSIDLDRHMYLKDIHPAAEVAAIRWKTILFNRIPL